MPALQSDCILGNIVDFRSVCMIPQIRVLRSPSYTSVCTVCMFTVTKNNGTCAGLHTGFFEKGEVALAF